MKIEMKSFMVKLKLQVIRELKSVRQYAALEQIVFLSNGHQSSRMVRIVEYQALANMVFQRRHVRNIGFTKKVTYDI